jgi:mono/diheme cytochrome c family protein
MTRIEYLILPMALVTTALTGGWASAQDGDRAQGLALARQICSECHTIDRSQAPSPNPASPRFETIANVPGMTAIALSAVLQSSHRTMPNVMLNPEELRNVIAYILSLRQAN